MSGGFPAGQLAVFSFQCSARDKRLRGRAPTGQWTVFGVQYSVFSRKGGKV